MLYDVAATVLRGLDDKAGSVKTLVLGSDYQALDKKMLASSELEKLESWIPRAPNKKQLYALVCETLKYRPVLEDLLASCSDLKLEKKLRCSGSHLLVVLLYDFLIGPGVRGASKYKKVLDGCKALLQAELERVKVKKKVSSIVGLKAAAADVPLPRYVRINTLRMSERSAVEALKAAGYQERLAPSEADSYFSEVQSLLAKEFMKDIHVSNLYAFAASTDFHLNPLYLNGTLILQDKASCIPAFVLAPAPGSMVVDACAAPGNKTSHAAAVMENRGTIHAFELDRDRYAIMQKLLRRAGASCVRPHLGDFTKCSPNDIEYSSAEYILVDPSCSGSGIVNRMNELTDAAPARGAARGGGTVSPETAAASELKRPPRERLLKLAGFQRAVLEHALSFPAAKRVVYSTCSVHEEENEQVVAEVLKRFSHSYQLEHVMPSWPYRGNDGGGRLQLMQACIRASLSRTCTNGFFVASFVRKQSDDDSSQAELLKTQPVPLLSAIPITVSRPDGLRIGRVKPSKRKRKRLREAATKQPSQ